MSYISFGPSQNILPFLQVLPENAYPEDVKNAISLVSFNKDKNDRNSVKIFPFGSYKYRIQQYPGDVDAQESYIKEEDIDDVVTGFEKDLKKTVKKIVDTKLVYFSEFKAGEDNRYNVNIGELINGIYTPNPELKDIIINMYEDGLFTDEDIVVLFEAYDNITKMTNADVYDSIKYIFREKLILRWTADEILKGRKISNGKIFTLTDSLKMKSNVKIDMITLLNGRFTEVTNFVMLAYIDNKSQVYPVNLNFNLADKKEMSEIASFQLLNEVEKLYFSNMYYSPFKMIKRLYSYGRQLKDTKLLELVIPIISSYISAIYQIKSEIDTIIIILERSKSIPKKKIFDQLGNIKERLSRIVEIDIDELDIILNIIDNINDTPDKKYKVSELSDVKKILVKNINRLTIGYLNLASFNPPSRQYLPEIMKYDYSLVRSEYDYPINPIKEILNRFDSGDYHSYINNIEDIKNIEDIEDELSDLSSEEFDDNIEFPGEEISVKIDKKGILNTIGNDVNKFRLVSDFVNKECVELNNKYSGIINDFKNIFDNYNKDIIYFTENYPNNTQEYLYGVNEINSLFRDIEKSFNKSKLSFLEYADEIDKNINSLIDKINESNTGFKSIHYAMEIIDKTGIGKYLNDNFKNYVDKLGNIYTKTHAVAQACLDKLMKNKKIIEYIPEFVNNNIPIYKNLLSNIEDIYYRMSDISNEDGISLIDAFKENKDLFDGQLEILDNIKLHLNSIIF